MSAYCRFTICRILALALVASLFVSPVAGAQPASPARGNSRTSPGPAEAVAPLAPPLQDVVQLAAADHTCALTSAGGVKCWGANYSGQLGDGTITSRSTPVDVIDLSSGVTTIAAGASHTCAVTSGGGVKCWGTNYIGQLGDGTTTSSSTPVDVVGLSGITAVATGNDHTCALTSGGGVKCWGWNYVGELGDGTTTDSRTPVDVVGLSGGVVALSGGGMHTCAVTGSGGVKCWGANWGGRLGDGTTRHSMIPVDVCAGGAAGCTGTLGDVTKVAAGESHTCALTSMGAVKCWGLNPYGQLGAGATTNQSTPVDVNGLQSGATALAAGNYHSCALVGNGRPKCWGSDRDGQLGLGTQFVRVTAVDVVAGAVPSLLLNYPVGKSGSVFTLTGFDFPASSPLTLTVNGAALPTTAVTDPSGGFIVFLDTAAAEAGFYTVTASANPSASAWFVLAPDAPLQVQEGGGLTVAIPAGLGAPVSTLNMPLVLH